MDRDRRVTYCGMVAAVVAAVLLPPDSIERLPSTCAFRRATGLPCPGCGLTRSWVLTAHGRLASAFQRHLFGPLSFATALVLLVRGPRQLPLGGLNPPTRRALAGVVTLWLSWALIRMGRDAG